MESLCASSAQFNQNTQTQLGNGVLESNGYNPKQQGGNLDHLYLNS